MSNSIISVTFQIDAQSHADGHFSVPRKVCDILDLEPGEEIALIIKSEKGILSVQKKLASGTEIYGPDIREFVKQGERIVVTASRP